MHTWAIVYLFIEWGLRLVMLFYVPQRRPPAAARTWLLLIFMQPILGGLLYAFLGRPHLSGRRMELQARVTQIVRERGRQALAPYMTRPVGLTQFESALSLADSLGDFPIVRDNQIELLPDYVPAIDALIADIGQAKQHVHLLYYIFADDQTGRRVADALLAARSRGVACSVLMDSLGSKSSRRRLAKELRAAGVEVLELLPWGLFLRKAARLDLRNHRKIAIIDGKTAYVGSQNIVDADFKRGLIYEELVLRVTGPVVTQLQAVFLGDRYFEEETGERDEGAFPEPDCPGKIAAQALPSGPGYPVANNQRLIVSLVHGARERIVFATPYFIPDEPLLQALQSAVLRGVEIHLIVPKQSDQVLVCLAQRSFYGQLLESGVRVHEYGRRFLHAKYASFDDSVALVGSSNMDLRSFQLNAEISLLIYDREFSQSLRQIQDRTISGAKELSRDGWQNRPLVTRMLQNTARLFDSLL